MIATVKRCVSKGAAYLGCEHMLSRARCAYWKLVLLLFPRDAGKYGWHGDYPSWQEARAKCGGYDQMQILQKVREGTARVRDGMAAFERDSVVFDKPQYNWPLLACLMLVAAENRGRLRVLDVGGALGSSYYQNRSLLADLQELSWCIVEQPHFVDVGRREFQDRTLKFCASYEEALGYGPNIALLSSVLPYMEAPYDALAKVEALNCAYILVDRTGFTLNDQDRLTVQRVPPHIYTASYPCWFLSKSRFLDALSAAYQLVVEFEGADHANIPAEYKGYLFRRREAV